MAEAPPPADALEDERDYQALLCSLLVDHLFELLDRADRLAMRGASAQLRDEADRCFKSLDCAAAEVKTAEETQRLLSLFGRLVSLRSLTLRSLEAVEVVFSDDGSHACSTRLEDLAIKLPSASGLRLTKVQLASVCRTGGLLRELCIGTDQGSASLLELPALKLCPMLTSLDFQRHIRVSDLSPLSALTNLKRLAAFGCVSVRSIDPLRGLSALVSLDIFGTSATSLQPLRSLTQLRELAVSHSHRLASLDPLSACTQLTKLRLGGGGRLDSLDVLRPLARLEDLDLSGIRTLASLDGLQAMSRLWKLKLTEARSVSTLEPLRLLFGMLDLELVAMGPLPFDALAPLASWAALRVLDLRESEVPLDLGPLTGCLGMRRLYVDNRNPAQCCNFGPLLWRIPDLVVSDRGVRTEWLDAREL